MVRFQDYKRVAVFEKNGGGTNSLTDVSSLSILSSRPSMGKTALAIQLACSINADEPLLYVSNESITNKILAHLTGISLVIINSNNLTIEENNAVTKANQKLNAIPLFTLENILLSQKKSLQEIRQAISLHQTKGVIIDGINWRNFKQNKCTQNDYIEYYKELKNLSNEFNIEVIILHELDRTVEKKRNG